MTSQFVSAIQEAIRTFILGMILVLVAVLGIIYSGINQELGTFLIEWNVALAVLTGGAITNLQTAIMSGLDKYLYKSGIDTPLNLKSMDKLK